jgi:hypothetical protein
MNESPILQTEVEYLKANQESLSQRYPGKHLVIQGQQVIDACDTRKEAADRGMKQTEGDFLVRHVDHPEDPVIFMPTVLGVELS